MIGNKIIILSLAFLLVLIMWAPWITKDFAENIVNQEFISGWECVSDGCGFNCDGCGIKEYHRTLFGYIVEIEYACGMLPSDSPEFHKTDKVYVSFMGKVFGLKKP